MESTELSVPVPEDQTTISEAIKSCQRQFQLLSSSLRSVSATQAANRVANQYDRLTLWAQDVGASDGNLDLLLHRSSSLKSCALKLLAELLHELTDPALSIDSLLEEVQDIINNLFSLEPALQNPAPLDELLDEILDLSPVVTNLHLDQHATTTSTLKVLYEAIRPTSTRPDVDVIAIASINGDSSWDWAGRSINANTPAVWISPLLPETMQNNGIYARLLSGTYDLSSEMVTQHPNLQSIANDFVKAINYMRLPDPDRQLYFIADGIGGILAKHIIQILIREGLSVNTNLKPVSGCMFFGVPRDMNDVSQLQKILGEEYGPKCEGPECYSILGPKYIHDNFTSLVHQYQIPVVSYLEPRDEKIGSNTVYPQLPFALPDTAIPKHASLQSSYREISVHFPDKEETVLLLAHQIAIMVELARQDADFGDNINLFSSMDHLPAGRARREDPFAMLVAYNTAILVNDSLTVLGEKWTTTQDLVRDLVDVVTNYDTEDVDLQLYSQDIQSYNVSDGVQAARLLTRTTPRGDEWDCAQQVKRYLQKYRTAPSSLKADGVVRPINMIILTGGMPTGSRRDAASLRKYLDEAIFQSSSGVYQVHIQIVSIVAEGDLTGDYWDLFDSADKKASSVTNEIAPTFKVNIPYSSNSLIVRRILLGAITTRFREPRIDPASTSMVEGGSVIGTESEVGSSLYDGTNMWSGKGKATTQGSSVTSGEAPLDLNDFGVSLLSRDSEMLPSPTLLPMVINADFASNTSKVVLDPSTRTIEPAAVFRRSGYGPVGFGEGDLGAAPSDRNRKGSRSEPGSADCAPSPSRSSPTSAPFKRPCSPEAQQQARSGSPPQSDQGIVLDLANPTQVPKRPATFHCHMCPKKFTRAYNLRSHLRTHTDERRYVCTVCGKAFARQHDRKRHEGLHSGEKKFVCRGVLQSTPTQSWGCGRRFARADALGRHFRSEAGRVCIRPLLEEEKREQQQQAQVSRSKDLSHLPQHPPLSVELGPSSSAGPLTLPVALLAQYPALQDVDWSAIETKDDPREMSDVSWSDRSNENYEAY